MVMFGHFGFSNLSFSCVCFLSNQPIKILKHTIEKFQSWAKKSLKRHTVVNCNVLETVSDRLFQLEQAWAKQATRVCLDFGLVQTCLMMRHLNIHLYPCNHFFDFHRKQIQMDRKQNGNVNFHSQTRPYVELNNIFSAFFKTSFCIFL